MCVYTVLLAYTVFAHVFRNYVYEEEKKVQIYILY